MFFGSISAMLLYGFFYVANYFTGNGIDEAVIFHLKAGVGGAGIKEYLGLIIATTVYVVVVSTLGFKIFKRININENSSLYLRRRSIFYAISAFFMVASFMTNPAIRDIYRLTSFAVAGEVYSTSEEFPNEFISNSPLIKNKKNIVYIYLESLEATYLDEELFPDLMPNIKALQQSATTFSDIKQVTHTGWTIAGMTASQCGIPLFSPSHRNSQGLDEFLPEANCLGDILKRNNYHLSYMAGADLSFAGKGDFYQTHSFDSIKGKKELSQNLKNIENMSGWGLYDDSLFSMLKDEYSRLSKSKKPFGLFTLTLDTHNPNGHTSQLCKNINYKDGSNPILNSVHCADVLVNDLVEYIKENPGENETIIAISSDHYAMKNTAWDDLNKGKRRNLFMVIEPASQKKGKAIDKRGSMLDIAPTLLSFLDTPVDGLGFGRNLNADVPSLVEKKKSIDAYLNAHQNVVKYLWSYPKLDNGIHYSLEDKDRLLLGDREVSLPAIFKLNDDANVDEIIFDNYGLKKLGDYMEEMNIGQGFIWADRCTLIHAFARSKKIDKSDKDKWCLSSGTTGASDISAWDLSDNIKISHTEIKNSLSSNDLNKASHKDRVTGMSNILKYGVAQIDTLSVSTARNMVGNVVVRSAGFGSGESYIEQNGTRVKLKRGLTLVGLKDTYKPIKLSHVDSCAEQVVDHATLEDTGHFATVINDYSESFDTFLVIGHDSVVCNDERNLLNATLSDADINQWNSVGYRQPYIGIISNKGKNKELIGEKEDALIFNIEKFTERVESVEKTY
jgi:Phosphoglycerol transferase and related proteins, alkaline phosphatase superfamily